MRWQRAILHVDMDAFYASVEVRNDPSLVGKPVIVGGTSSRGVVAACTYEARSYGVRSAMSSNQARQLCPHAVFLPGNFDDYQAISAQIFEVFREVSPLVEGLSLDEAFIDVTGSQQLFGEPREIALHLRGRVFEVTQLRASVGIASNKTIAKLASKQAKPAIGPPGSSAQPTNGYFEVLPGGEQEFLRTLPVRALWGVGPVTADKLDARGITTVKQIEELTLDQLRATLGNAHAQQLFQLARGIDPRPVVANQDAKSIGQEETYQHDRHSADDLHHDLVQLADRVANRLALAETAGQTVSLKLGFASRRSVTRSRTLDHPTSDAGEIREVAQQLLATVDIDEPVRLCGISLSKLGQPQAVQLSLVDTVVGAGGEVDATRSAATARMVADVRRRFGRTALGPASLLGTTPDRTSPWGPTRQYPLDDPTSR
jgi:DNA polymerase-4